MSSFIHLIITPMLSIYLSELKDAPLTNVSLTGYDPIIHANSVTNAGSVRVYISNKFFTFIIIEKSDCF